MLSNLDRAFARERCDPWEERLNAGDSGFDFDVASHVRNLTLRMRRVQGAQNNLWDVASIERLGDTATTLD